MDDQFLTIDIGGTNVKYALMDKAGNISVKSQIPSSHDKVEFLKSIDKIVNDNLYKIKGVAFSAPGKVQNNTIFYGGSLPFLHSINFEKRYSSLNLAVSVINDGKAAALAEHWLGNLAHIDNCASITLGTGVGGGIIINGQLLKGFNAQAGELSAMFSEIHISGYESLFGSRASAVEMIKNINIIAKNPDILDGKKAFVTIHDDPEAKKIFEAFCHNVAILIANIQSVLDLERITIGGGISAQPILISEINAQYKKILASVPLIESMFTPVEIQAAKFKNDANLYGALYNLLLQINKEDVFYQ